MEFLPRLWFLVGSTAAGKTALSVELARFLGAEILSCDSVQVYRGADIGSGKITPGEMANIPHHGLDLCGPDAAFDVRQYAEYASIIVKQMQEKRKNLLVVGGAGFYLKSFFTPVSDSIIVPENVRREVRQLYERAGLAGLQREIAAYGPTDFNHSDWHNPRRLLNILGKQRVVGQSQEKVKQNFMQKICPLTPFPRRVILLERDSESLNRRIERRVEAMLRGGLVDEVKFLGKMCLPLANAIGYREVRNYLDGGQKMTPEELKRTIVAATLRLVKKQKMWFRKQIPIHCSANLDARSANESFDFIRSFCKNSGLWN
ncbi:MAG: tRNA (adenosine(37)-N6)-dimethylallyltransferase MiaA [Puniceicoccales bacterium]|jgi:tRNA dimethylallyltransferase|nr:tRNA (adenosine(37)-N6)-dimethylallyltransferase MiaA [Puniceicoccales bacterium]